jgi:SAM-dependent MidA family methyltransferase
MAKVFDTTPGTAGQSASVASALDSVVRRAITDNGGWLPFDRYMALALYAPGLGYYANHRRKFGSMPSSGSDFVTAPELSPLFAQALAAQVAQALLALAGATGPPQLMEFGAGSGALAEGLLDALDALGDARLVVRHYAIVDLSGTLRQRQQARLARFGDRVQWLDALPEAFDGVVLGNEVLDAMPVQLLAFDGQHWFERGVVVADAALVQDAAQAEGHVELHPELQAECLAWSDRPTALRPPLDADFVPGTVVEIHPQAEAFVRTLAGVLRRGVALFIDYGFPEAEFYLPQRHSGTLMCHQAHRADTDPLVEVGAKDITAHVNFSGIALAGQDAGLDVIGYTSQARFLINCGLVDLLAGASLAQRAMAQKLINEHEMGELFKVIAMSRGLRFDPLGFAQGDRTHRL